MPPNETIAEEPAVNNTRAPSLGHIGALDGIRAVAMADIFVFHLTTTFQRGGHLAISLFFTLSGFLITSLLLAERNNNGQIQVIGFYQRRARRLVPAALVNAAFILGLTVFAATSWPRDGIGGDTLSAVTNVYNWRLISEGKAEAFRFLSPFSPQWSLAVEEQFYLVVPLVLFVAFRLGGRRRAIGIIAALGMAVSVGISLAIDPGPEFGLAQRPMEFYRTDVRMVELLAGVLLATLVPTWRIANRYVAEVLGWVGLIGTFLVWTYAEEHQAWIANGGLFAITFLSAALIYGAMSDGPLAKILAFGPLQYLGRLTYGIYLFHWPVFLVTRDIDAWGSNVALFVIRTLITVGLAALSYHFVERPIRQAKVLPGRQGIVAWVVAAIGLVIAGFVIGT